MKKGPGMVMLTTKTHPGSMILLNRCIELGLNVIAIIESDTVLPKDSNLKDYIKLFQKMGFEQSANRILLALRFSFRMYYTIALSYLGVKQRFLTTGQISKKHKIPYIKTKDINSPSLLEYIGSFEPDLIVSCYFNQILKSEVINLAKIRCVNVHLALAQNYRGLNSYLWVLVNGDSETGVTLHEIDEGIDTGRIIAQEKVKIEPSDSALGLFLKLCHVGTELFIKSYDKIIKGEFVDIDISGSKYYSVLDSKGYAKLKQKGRKFVKGDDLARFF